MSYKLENLPNGDLRITVEGTKYTFVKPDPGKVPGRYGVCILRHGEAWVEHPPGENAIMCLMWVVEALHGKIDRALKAIDEHDGFRNELLCAVENAEKILKETGE